MLFFEESIPGFGPLFGTGTYQQTLNQQTKQQQKFQKASSIIIPELLEIWHSLTLTDLRARM
jgi:hypothetical protein